MQIDERAGWYEFFEDEATLEQHVFPSWEIHNLSRDCACCPIEAHVDTVTGIVLIEHNERSAAN